MSSAKLWEEGKLDLDAPIQTYVTSFPEKTFNGATTTLTTRHLLSHLGGIRHYEKTPPDNVNKENKVSVYEWKGHGDTVGCHKSLVLGAFA